MDTDLREQVRSRYAAAAEAATQGRDSSCGASDCCGTDSFGSTLYDEESRGSLPDGALRASLGCGNPTAIAELRAGETVLDLGSGGGIDALLSARRVGPEGKVYGLDMTEEMLALAVANRDEAGAHNVEFLKGVIESIPLPAATVDVVISNCVINLSVDKSLVFAETFRVLRPGGRLGISDVVASDELTVAERADRGSWVGCIAGALSFSEYEAALAGAGFSDISVTSTHEVAEGLHSAIVRAVKPAVTSEASERASKTLPLARTPGCC